MNGKFAAHEVGHIISDTVPQCGTILATRGRIYLDVHTGKHGTLVARTNFLEHPLVPTMDSRKLGFHLCGNFCAGRLAELVFEQLKSGTRSLDMVQAEVADRWRTRTFWKADSHCESDRAYLEIMGLSHCIDPDTMWKIVADLTVRIFNIFSMVPKNAPPTIVQLHILDRILRNFSEHDAAIEFGIPELLRGELINV